MKLLLTRKKYIVKLFCFIFLFLLPLITVDAKGSPFMSCKYGSEDGKIEYELKINKNFTHSGVILKHNGKSESNKEPIENWGSDKSNTVAFIKNSGICPRELNFKTGLFGAYHINFPTNSNANLFLVNTAETNIYNLINFSQLPGDTTCPFYDENNVKKTVPIPNSFWEGLNDIADGEAKFETGNCNTDGLDKVIIVSDPNNPNLQFVSPGIKPPNSCIDFHYNPALNEMSKVNYCREWTRLPKNEDGTVDEPDPLERRVTVAKQYESKNTEIGQKFKYEIVYDPASSWFVGHNISFIKEKDKSYMVYDGTYDKYRENYLDPMITELKWPSKIYCERVFGYTTFTPTCNVVSEERTTTPKCSDIENTSIVCSVDPKPSQGGGINRVYEFNFGGDVKDNLNDNNGNFVDVYSGKPINCSDFATKEGSNMIQDIFDLIMLIAPILVIVLGGLDFAKASLQSDEDAIKKAGINFGKRLIAAVLLFLLPLIINIVLEIAFEAGVLESIPEICID